MGLITISCIPVYPHWSSSPHINSFHALCCINDHQSHVAAKPWGPRTSLIWTLTHRKTSRLDPRLALSLWTCLNVTGLCLTWVTITGPHSDSQIYHASLAWTRSSSQSCLTVWTLCWRCLPSPGWSCSPDLGTVGQSLAGKIPTLPITLSPAAPSSLSHMEQTAPAALWHLRSNCSIFCVDRSQELILTWVMIADQMMTAESEIKHTRQENPAHLSRAHTQFGLNGGSFKYLAWPRYAEFLNTSSPNSLLWDTHSVGRNLWSNCSWQRRQRAVCPEQHISMGWQWIYMDSYSQPLALAPFLMALRLPRALNDAPCGVLPTQDLNSRHSAIPKML